MNFHSKGMRSLRHRINPKTFVISLRQIAKLLKVNLNSQLSVDLSATPHAS
ncbi:hypothetical protein [Microseira sp. BLCC-F43]|uniref:hypothetical protein n=1 Tax=Microseira sp. BLCC-F43 TaxID=3153602 RepID=UPI0035B835BE